MGGGLHAWLLAIQICLKFVWIFYHTAALPKFSSIEQQNQKPKAEDKTLLLEVGSLQEL
jgi:hypothetical protein